VHILPYLEETNVYKHINHEVSVYHDDHAAVRQLVLSPLVCPSDRGAFAKFATSSYAACHHDVEAPIDTDNNGVFFLNSRIGQDDVSDGLAYTIFLGEKTAEDLDRGWMSGTRATLRNTGTPLNMTGSNGVFVPLGSPPATVIDYGGYGETPRPAGGAASDAPAEQSEEPLAADGDSDPETQAGDNGPKSEELTEPVARDGESPAASGARAGSRSAALYVGGFGSHHPTGANMAFGDGVVKFMSEAISPQVYQQLGHRADGQLLSSDQFR
jgi:hypothetical protein